MDGNTPSIQGLGDDLGGEQQTTARMSLPPLLPHVFARGTKPCVGERRSLKDAHRPHPARRTARVLWTEERGSTATESTKEEHATQAVRPRAKRANKQSERGYALDARPRGRSWWRTATTARISSPTYSRTCLRLTPVFEHGREAQSRAPAKQLPRECTPPSPRPADGPRALDRGAREHSDRVDEGRARDTGRPPASEASQTTQQPPPSPRD